MKIIAFNQDIIWKDQKANLQLIEKAFENQVADLFLLPEMFSTGFYMKPEEVADEDETVLNWMKTFAKNKNTAIAGSVSVKENNQFYNRFYFVKPDADFYKYDKKHLFSYTGEEKVFTAGNERVIVDYKDFRVLLQVCYDLRFPVFARNRNDYDVILNVANWPETRIDAWKTLLKARAIENQCFVMGVNRVGMDGNNLSYPESSYCFFADGTEISTKMGDLLKVELDVHKLEDFRGKFPFLRDADDFTLDL